MIQAIKRFFNDPEFYDSISFIFRKRDVIYFAWSDSKIEDGKILSKYSFLSRFAYNILFRKKPQIIVEEEIEGVNYVRIFVFRNEELKKKSGLSKEDLVKELNHEKIGLALGFPKFAIEDFLKNPKNRLKVFVKWRRSLFIIENSESRIEDLKNWAKQNGIAWRNIKIKELGGGKK
ncbi:MAG: hypothetical protein Q4A21_03005 [bacterium]|nr:hypothetical protein [bacterium]